MEIRIPLERSHVLAVLWAAATALIRGAATLQFTTAEINGKKRPVVLSRDDLAELQRAYTEAQAHAQLMREMVEDVLARCPMQEPWMTELREGMKAIERRTLH